jgi:chemotaxis protein methyltransferase CheR
MKIAVLKRMHSSLKPNGHLIIGYYDVLPFAARELFQPVNPEVKVYRKVKN